MMYDDLGKFGFDFLSGVKNPPIHLITTGIQQVDSPTYRYDNTHREECYLFQYTLSGSGIVVTNGEKHIVEKGKGFFLRMPEKNEYYFDKNTSNEPWRFIYARFKGYGCEPYYKLITENNGNIISQSENSPCIRALFEINRKARLGLIKDSFTCERLIFDFLCRLCTDTLNNEDGFSEIVIKARCIINSDYQIIEGIFDIAQQLGVSQSHLSRVFSSETKQSPIEYLTFVRLREAINLLNDTEATIEEIAKKCGFSCGNYFCKVFRKHMSISPLDYRHRNK